ncbi:kinase-like protein [Auricularia subglabra TFB-10046 SS5]|nr:kinase-like protein [Auricularia subglabra TFB-10046 SS5]
MGDSIIRYVSKADFPPRLYLEGVTVSDKKVHGGFSDVHRGMFAETGEQVAIKKMRYMSDNTDDESDEDGEENETNMDKALEKEVTVLMKVRQHPNILRLLGLVTIGKTPCIVTRWAAHGPLTKHLKPKTTSGTSKKLVLSVLDKKRLIIEVAAALVFLHSGQAMPDGSVVVHGDLHTDNVLIDTNKSAILADFGICKIIPPGCLASVSVRPGAPAGRAAYLAPELHQINEGTLRDVGTDTYSFGMLLYEMLGGNLSEMGNSFLAIAMEIKDGNRPARFSGLSDNVWNLIESCWGVPGKRPTMAIVHKKLENEWPDAATAAANAYAAALKEAVVSGPAAAAVAVTPAGPPGAP